jgi:hypothetical protein
MRRPIRFPRVRAVVLVGGAIFVLAQVLRPPLPNPPVVAELDAPADVRAVLRVACYDCHSNETRLRWFDEVVPAYWLVVRDVRAGRARLNFSEIGNLPAPQQTARLYEAIDFVALGEMPPAQYTALHGEARLTSAQLAVLKAYAERRTGPAPPVRIADLPLPVATGEVLPAPNGIRFPSEYDAWSPISVTDRADNGTFRAVTANPIAANAVAAGNVPPWPDGAALAKISLRPSPDGRAPAFVQVEFMLKDARRFSETEGWGWARWVGAGLKPYGDDAHFDRECMGCHAPMRRNDNVYTLPLTTHPGPEDVFNTRAALPTAAPVVMGRLRSISVDDSARTMAALFARGRREPGATPDGPGADLSLVTWEQRDDPHWYGARIPGSIVSLETVTLPDAPEASATYGYYAGQSLKRSAPPGGASDETRIAAILAHNPASGR